MNMSIEILAPVGSSESLSAAVRCGADAVYLGAKDFSARRNATNFDDKQLKEAVDYCHLYQVKVYVTVNILIKQKEIEQVYQLIEKLYEYGVDGLIVQDLGLAEIIHRHFPDIELHGSTQMSIHHPGALPFLKQAGFKRVCIAREMSQKEIKAFCDEAKKYGIEVECFVHGALCMSVSGQCLLSAMIGQRSGNRGLCAQPCRLPFSAPKGTGHDLSLKDSSLFAYVGQLEEMGVASLKIEGRMKRPEYVALATHCCKQAVEGKAVDTKLLQDVFSRSGFTDGYYTGKLGRSMFGIRSKEDVAASQEVLKQIHELYRNEKARTPVCLKVRIVAGEPVEVRCGTVMVKGELPLEATGRPTTVSSVQESLGKLGNTPYYLADCQVDMEEGLFVRNSTLNQLRRDLVEKLNQAALKPVKRQKTPLHNLQAASKEEPLKFYVRLSSLDQLPTGLQGIEGLIVPIDSELNDNRLPYIIEIPRWITNESYIVTRLEMFKQQGITKAYCNNISAVLIAQKCGYQIIGGNFLNVFNNYSLEVLQSLGIQQASVSAELSLAEIRQINFGISKGIIGYGRLPLMLLRNCPLKNGRSCDKCDKKGYLTDRTNTRFPVRCSFGFGELLNSPPVYLADKLAEIKNTDFMYLYFTLESSQEVEKIIEGYQNQQKVISDYTRGLYYRSVY